MPNKLEPETNAKAIVVPDRGTRHVSLIDRLHMPNIQMEAHASMGQRMLAEQLSEARIIKIDPWFTERARETVVDYLVESGSLQINAGESENEAYRRFLGEMGMDPGKVGDKPKLATAGRIGEARLDPEAFQRQRIEASNRFEVLDWTAYLDEITARRQKGHVLIWHEPQGATFFGFIDHEGDEFVFIERASFREWRTEARANPKEMTRLAEIAGKFGFDSAEAAIAASRSPATRSAILGWSPYGNDQSMLPDDWTQWPKETDSCEDLPDLEAAGLLSGGFTNRADFGMGESNALDLARTVPTPNLLGLQVLGKPIDYRTIAADEAK